MKGIVGGIVVLIGLMLIIVAFAAPSFSVVTVVQTSSPNGITENTTASTWNFDVSSSGEIISGNGLMAMWTIPLNYWIYGGQTFTLKNIGVEIQDSQLTTTQGGSPDLLEYGIGVGYLNLSVNNVVISYTLSETNPYGNGNNYFSSMYQLAFVFSPSFTVPSGIYAKSSTLTLAFVINPRFASDMGVSANFNNFHLVTIQTNNGQPTTSGGFTSPQGGIAGAYGFYYPMINVGQYYIYQPSNSTWVHLAPSSSITLSYSKFPVTIEFAYVENNGTTTDLASMYLTMNGNNLPIASTNHTSIDGYNAYSILIHITAPGTYTINGYLGTTYNTNLQLMSFVYNTGSQTGSGQNTTPTTSVNYVTLGIGSVFILIGGILIWRRK